MNALVALMLILGLMAPTEPSPSQDLVPLQSTTMPNLGAARIAARYKLAGRTASLFELTSNLVRDRLFEASFDKRSDALIADAAAKIEGGANVAVLIAEIYTNIVGYSEIGPIKVVPGDNIKAALEQFAADSAQPAIRKNRVGATKSYRVRVLSKSDMSRGFTEEAFPNELIRIALRDRSLEDAISESRAATSESIVSAAASSARETRSRLQRDTDGPRENSTLLGGRERSRDNSTSAERPESRPSERREAEQKAPEMKRSREPEIIIH